MFRREDCKNAVNSENVLEGALTGLWVTGRPHLERQ